MADRHRSREPREAGERRHKKRRSTQDGRPSDRPRSSRPAALSMDALAALNDANVRGPSTQEIAEEELERQRRHERRERRRRESRAKIDRDEYREVARSSPPRAHRKRESRSYAAAPDTPTTYDDVEAESDYQRERRHRRRERSSRALAYESAPAEDVPRASREIMAEKTDRGKRREEHRKKPRTVMASSVGAGAAAGNSKGFWHTLRGGRGKQTDTNASTSYDSFHKDGEYYEGHQKKRFWTRRKICEFVVFRPIASRI